MKRLVLVILVGALVLPLIFLPLSVHADALPDWTVQLSACLLWNDPSRPSWQPDARYRVTIVVRNIGTGAGPSVRAAWTTSYNRFFDVPALGPGGQYVKTLIVTQRDYLQVSVVVNNWYTEPSRVPKPEANPWNNGAVIQYRTPYYNASWASSVPLIPWCPGSQPLALGFLFVDKNHNGRHDAGEPGVKGAAIQLWQGNRWIRNAVPASNSGYWALTAPAGGTYSLTAIVPKNLGAVQWTTPRAYYGVPLTGGRTGPYYFGIAPVPPPPPRQKPIAPRPEGAIAIPRTTSHPVVVTQDPDRRGADVYVTIRSHPVTYIWYEFDSNSGRWLERRSAVTSYVDLNSIRLTASLSGNSQRWIRTELAQKYPGARVHRVFWNLRAQPTYRVILNRVLSDGTHEVQIRVTRIPFQDPGIYNITLRARTTGTRWPGSSASDVQPPAETSTAGINLQASTSLRVWLLDTKLEQ